MKKKILIGIILIVFFGCTTTKNKNEFRDKYMFSVELGNSNFTENIKFIDSLDLIIIPVEISGKSYNFLFDTGSVTMVSPSFRDNLIGINVKDKTRISDAAGYKVNSDFSIIPKLSIGNIQFLNVGTNVTDLSIFENRCISIDGIIGANLMRTCFWKIDYDLKIISFSDSKDNVKISNPALKLSFNETFGGNPKTKFKFSNYDFWMTWDTGYNNSIQLADSLIFKTDSYPNLPIIKGRGMATATLFGENDNLQNQYKAVLDTLFFEDTDKKEFLEFIINQEVDIVPNPAPLLIGNKFLKSASKVFFDWRNKEISFEKLPNSSISHTFGFIPFKVNNSIQVISIWENSLAEIQGLQVGDTLIFLNGEKVENLNTHQWCNTFSRAKKKESINFTTKNKNVIKKYSLKKYSTFNIN